MTRWIRTMATLSVLAACALAARPGPGDPARPSARAGTVGEAVTPPPGSPLRKAVLGALRRELPAAAGLELRFVVRDLRVEGGWAWVHTQPQSADGRSRLEDVLALLRLEDDAWKVVEIPCTEAGNAQCVDGPGYFSRLVERFPGVPRGILPE